MPIIDNCWSKDLLLSYYPEIIQDKGINIENKPLILKDVDNNGLGNCKDFEAFVYANRGLLASQIDFIDWGKGLKTDNIINLLFYLESDLYADKTEVSRAYQGLTTLINEIKTELNNPQNRSLTTVDKILIAYKILQKNYVLKPQDNASFVDNFYRGRLDCDTSSFVIIALAQEMIWDNVKLIQFPGHSFIRCDGINIDYGKSLSDQFYIDNSSYFGERKTVIKALLKNEIDLNNLAFLFYFNRANYDFDQEQYGKAIEDYTEAIRSKPDFVTAFYNRSISYKKNGQHYKALKDYVNYLVR